MGASGVTGLGKTSCWGLAGLGRAFDLRPRGVNGGLGF